MKKGRQAKKGKIDVRITEEMKDKLDKLATDRDVSIGRVVREALENYLSDEVID